MAKNEKQPQSYWTKETWPHYPPVIAFIQQQRNAELKKSMAFRRFNVHRGMNATIVILACSSVEGFQKDCLETFASILNDKGTMTNRLYHHYLERVISAEQVERQTLFKIATGATLEEQLAGKKLKINFRGNFLKVEANMAIQRLFMFRNCLAHARPMTYIHYGEKDEDTEEAIFKMEQKGFGKIEEFLIENGIFLKSIGANVNECLMDDSVDFFAALVRPYMEEVCNVLPMQDKIFSMQHLIKVAFRGPFED